MGKKSDKTKQTILLSAKKLFLEKGYDGLRMQELADKAQVNKGLLHHYFKNKDNLFISIFSDAVGKLFSVIAQRFGEEYSIEQKINGAVDAYFDMLLSNPHLPLFVLSELQRDPQRLLQLFQAERMHKIVEDFSGDNPEDNSGVHLMVTLVSLCVFPFMARPIIMEMSSHLTSFNQLIEQRRSLVKSLVVNLSKSL